jgi:rhamnogalacturonan hydrolase
MIGLTVMQDECVTVKSPSKNILVENVYCNWSGGCAMGSLGEDVDVADITYRNIYTVHSDQMVCFDSRWNPWLTRITD